MMQTRWVLVALALAVAPACKKKQDDASGGTAAGGTGTASAAMPDPGSGIAPGTGTGSDMAAAGTGSAAPAGPEITFADVPAGWEIGEGKGELAVAVNESKFPVDNAVFTFEYGFEPADATTDPKQYKTTKKLANGNYYESKSDYRYVLDAGDKKIFCGGSLYRDTDHDKIPKERDAAVAAAKKLCASAKVK